MAEFVPEVLVHLDSDRVDLRIEAATALIHLVDRDDSIEIDATGLTKIYNCFMDKNNDLSSVAAALLTNLFAGKSDVLSAIEIPSAFAECVAKVKKDTIHTNTFLMFLSNLTIEESSCQTVFSSPDAIDSIRYLLDAFLTYNPQAVEFDGMTSFDEFDIYQHAGSFVCNMCRLEDFRKILFNMEHPYLGQFFDQIRSRNPVRRRSAVATIRTCLFNKEIHHWVLYELKGLTALLLPLVTSTPFTDREKIGMDPILWMQGESKQYEPEVDIRLLLVECLHLLCQKRTIRDELRKRKAYPVIKNLAQEQEDDKVDEAIIDVVNLTMRDEDPDAPADEDAPVDENVPVHEESPADA